jgi:hypothetical protein
MAGLTELATKSLHGGNLQGIASRRLARQVAVNALAQAGADNIDRAPWHAKLSREYPLK